MRADPAMVGAPAYERVENDLYETPAWVTEVILRNVRLGKVWEPACGNGAMVDVMAADGLDVFASDLTGPNSIDFLEEYSGPWGMTSRDIVTNPPYKLAEEFIRRALEITKIEKRKVAMVLRNEFDSAHTRRDLFEKEPFAMKIVLTRRPQWIAGPLRASPRHNYAIFVWDWLHRGPASIRYDR